MWRCSILARPFNKKWRRRNPWRKTLRRRARPRRRIRRKSRNRLRNKPRRKMQSWDSPFFLQRKKSSPIITVSPHVH
jgi:hypothetical protein